MNIIEFEDVIKTYKIYYGSKSLRNEFYDLILKISGKQSGNKGEFQALKNISFQIPKGSTVGLIGSNGSGKSTILKLMSKVTYPTSGKIKINGTVASLLEIGAGFHEEFTARENIYLNGALLGLSRKQIDEKFDEIVDFSELKQFIDTPVKKYSSGMYVKLGFSIAIHVNPDILLIDEVLSVGDANFQNKCIKKIREIMSNNNRTVILVSHNMVTIQALCDKTLWFEKGTVRAFDETNKVITQYSEEINKRVSSNDKSHFREHKSDIYSSEIKIMNYKGEKTDRFSNENVFIELIYNIDKVLNDEPIIIFTIEAVDLGLPIASISTKDKIKVKNTIGNNKILFNFPIHQFSARECSIRVSILSHDMLIHYDIWYDSIRFNIIDNSINMIDNSNDIIKLNYEFQ